MMTWDELASSDLYRTAPPEERAKMKEFWFQRVAPRLHPEAMSNIQGQMAILKYISSAELPPKPPDEDEVIPPESLSMTRWSAIERNPSFQQKKWPEQQMYKNIWYHRMAATDPE